MADAAAKRKALSYIGFAARSRAIAVGTEAVISEIRKCSPGTVAVVLATDASERTKKQINDKCTSHGAPVAAVPLTKDEIAGAAGKKTSVSAVAVTNRDLVRALTSLGSE